MAYPTARHHDPHIHAERLHYEIAAVCKGMARVVEAAWNGQLASLAG
jgi:hypothetical protein